MTKKKDRAWITFIADDKTQGALERHRRRLERERGTRVTKSDAARDAIARAVAS